MSTSTIQFITQVKLAELRRQRSLLLESYDRIAHTASVGTPVEGLRALYDGLRDVRVANKRLHPDKLETMKFDPVARKHVKYKESKIK